PSHSTPLSLHDALPISVELRAPNRVNAEVRPVDVVAVDGEPVGGLRADDELRPAVRPVEARAPDRAGAEVGPVDVGAGEDEAVRSEEHTSELQSRENLV